jgi:hypothetical protein
MNPDKPSALAASASTVPSIRSTIGQSGSVVTPRQCAASSRRTLESARTHSGHQANRNVSCSADRRASAVFWASLHGGVWFTVDRFLLWLRSHRRAGLFFGRTFARLRGDAPHKPMVAQSCGLAAFFWSPFFAASGSQRAPAPTARCDPGRTNRARPPAARMLTKAIICQLV